jgi:inner membrane protein
MDGYFIFWAWFIAAVALACGELAVPGIFLIWLAGAAAVTGIITWITGIGWEAQLACFAVLSVISVYLGRAYFKRNPIQTEDVGLNRRGERMVGEIVIVVEALSDGSGKVQVGDSPWLAKGPDLAVGAKARIVRAEGTTLVVEAA